MSDELWPVEQVEGERPRVAREVLVEASPEEVWEAIATESGRERWLEEGNEREVQVAGRRSSSRRSEPMGFPDPLSQSRAVPSKLPVRMVFPLEAKAMA